MVKYTHSRTVYIDLYLYLCSNTRYLPWTFQINYKIPFAQRGPVNPVAEQSQTKRFHPSEHEPSFIQGLVSHCGG
jgi:hypothetical protein